MAGDDDAPQPAHLPNIRLPDQLHLGENAVKNWKIFRQRWESYVLLTSVDQQDLAKQKAIFINCLDDESLEAYNTLELTAESTINEVLQAFEKFVLGECNETYERFIFNKRNQEAGERFELFYAHIQRLIKTCNFCNDCQKSILRDRIVLGVQDVGLQKDLLKVRNLTLEVAIDMCKASEKAVSHNSVMRENNPHVNRVFSHDKNQPLKSCKFCGQKHKWSKQLCPAYGKTCTTCNRPNHFSKMCQNNAYRKNEDPNKRKNKQKNVHKIDEPHSEESSDDTAWIHQISLQANKKKQVKCNMLIDEVNVPFQIDCGSSVNIIPVKYLKNRNEISVSDTMLKTWTNDNYKPLGECRKVIVNPKNNKKYNVNFIVCHNDFVPIIGLSASEQMKLIEIKDENFEIVNKIDLKDYSDVFNDVQGSFEGEHAFKLREGAQPSIMPQRRTPIAMKD